MAERYTRVFSQQEQIYCPGAPVVIQAGALLKDNQTGNIIAQLKFKSISPKTIQALVVKIRAKDISGLDIEGVDSFQYLDLNVHRDGEFGSKTPITLPNAVARSFSCECLSAVFTDGTKWGCTEGAQWDVLPEPTLLASEIGLELAEQFARDTGCKTKCAVTDHHDLWYCTCGAINQSDEDACHSCQSRKTALLEALNVETLTANKQKYDDEVAAQQAEAEIKQKKLKKRRTIIASIALAVVVLIVSGIAIYNKVTALTIEKMLALSTKEDVVALLGEPSGTTVSFMGEDYYTRFTYSDNTITDWILLIQDSGSTPKNATAAKAVVSELVETFAEKYGDPQVLKTTYTWIVNNRKIDVEDYTGSSTTFAKSVIISVNCDLQTFCEHAETEKEHLDANCVENGYDRTTCTVCGYVDETVINALGHSGSAEITQAATCTQTGIQTRTCSVCATRVEESIPALGHDHKKVATKAAGCTTAGTYTHTCSRCSDSYTTQISALGHSMSSPTCTTDGKCSRCGAKGESAYGHSWDTEERTIYDSDGYHHYRDFVYCKRCKKDYEPNIKIVGKDFPVNKWSGDYSVVGVEINEIWSTTYFDGKFETSAWIDIKVTGNSNHYIVYKIYNSAGELIIKETTTLSSDNGQPYDNHDILVTFPGDGTYYIAIS